MQELTYLAPRLQNYLKTTSLAWPDIVEPADFLRGELGVSKSLWGEACLTMGRGKAVIAIAIVSAKDPEHFRTTPGGYFRGMVEKEKAGQLNLIRTIWGLRRAVEAKHGRAQGRGGERRPPARPWH
jgi:replication initiation protein RepC